MRSIAWYLFLFSSVCLANVSDEKPQVFGTQWKLRAYQKWLRDDRALITPEVAHLAVQACMRKSQQDLDVQAYGLAKNLMGEMEKAYLPSGNAYTTGLSALTQLLREISAINADSAAAYRTQCETRVTARFGNVAFRNTLSPLFQGRLQPGISPNLPPELRQHLLKLAEKGISVAPLTWGGLQEQICQLEGYYSTSKKPELWKFFSITRALGNVLPAEDREGEFVTAVTQSDAATRLLSRINQYSSVAGKFNGPTIGMTSDEMIAAEMRLTGPALGSRAPSLLAFFTTAWRERLQKLILEQDYPEKPFALLSATQVLTSLGETARDTHQNGRTSQTELGMVGVWEMLLPFAFGGPNPEWGGVTADYKKTSALAWLALNAETNIRQNEKLAGFANTSIDTGSITTRLYGTATQYAGLVGEIAAAEKAYAALGSIELPRCLNGLDAFAQAARDALGYDARVATLGIERTKVLGDIKIEPVIADIGMEVNDERGDQPGGIFRLHLATGEGHQVEVAVQGENYRLWTPSSMVLHLDSVHTTAQWQQSEELKYDPPFTHQAF
jgi:hypothetical protein